MIPLRADVATPSPAASLIEKVRAATPDARALLKRAYVYATAADTDVLPDAVIRRAYPRRAAESLEWLAKTGICERVAGDDSEAFWSIAGAYDRRDLRGPRVTATARRRTKTRPGPRGGVEGRRAGGRRRVRCGPG